MPRMLAVAVALIGCLAAGAPARLTAQTDLDAFMQQVVARSQLWNNAAISLMFQLRRNFAGEEFVTAQDRDGGLIA